MTDAPSKMKNGKCFIVVEACGREKNYGKIEPGRCSALSIIFSPMIPMAGYGGRLVLFTSIKSIRNSILIRLATLAVCAGALTLAPSALSFAHQDEKKKAPLADTQKKEDGKVPSEKELEKSKKQQEKAPDIKLTPAQAIAELTILAYGGRDNLRAARSAFQEEGTVRLASDQGYITGSYMMRSMRKDKSWQDLLRADLELTSPEAAQRQGAPGTVKYIIAFNGASVWSAQNDQYVVPRPEAEAAFRAQLVHDFTTLLRYKEDGSTLELKDPETVVGVQTNVIDLTTPNGDKTRYWISSKTFRIVHLEYELINVEGQPPTKYRISFYYTPYRVAQNTLVPTRRVMMQDGKFVQEIILTTIIASAKLDPEIFQHLQQ
jgi:hypothetical protein